MLRPLPPTPALTRGQGGSAITASDHTRRKPYGAHGHLVAKRDGSWEVRWRSIRLTLPWTAVDRALRHPLAACARLRAAVLGERFL